MNLKKLTRIILLVAVLLVLSIVPVNAVVFNAAFDSDFYVNCYPDLKAAFGNDANAAYNHYLTYGIKEGRIASPVFDAKAYIRNYPDLQAAFGDDYVAAYNHFLTNGMNEGRLASDSFNVQVYIANYPDLQAAFGNDVAGAYNHYLNYGMAEGRVCGALEAGAEAPEDHVHAYDELVRTISTATCQVAGEGIFKCTCGEEMRKEIPASPDYHDYVVIDTIEGIEVSKCTICGDVVTKIPEDTAHTHEYVEVAGENNGKIEPTCTTEGKVFKQCVCGDVIEETIPMIDHVSSTPVGEGKITVGVTSCEKDGAEEVTCDVCHQKFIRTISAHKFEKVSEVVATCTEEGVATYKCKTCGETKVEVTEKIAHEYRTVENASLAPTCVKAGLELKVCAVCGNKETKVLKALGHKKEGATPLRGYAVYNTKGELQPVTENDETATANCTQDVAETYTCQNDGCTEVITEVVEKKLGHRVDTTKKVKEGIVTGYDKDGFAIVEEGKVDCTHDRVKVYTCANCKKEVVAVITKASAHTPLAGSTVVYGATCDRDGYKTYTCTTCNQKITEETGEKALGHNFVIVPATCTEDAKVECSRCHATGSSVEGYDKFMADLSEEDTEKATAKKFGHKIVGATEEREDGTYGYCSNESKWVKVSGSTTPDPDQPNPPATDEIDRSALDTKKAALNGKISTDYDNWDAVNNAIKAAETIASTEGKTQADFDTAVNAIPELVVKALDTTEFDAIDIGAESDYTAGWDDIEAANQAVEDANKAGTLQSEFDKLVDALNDAIAAATKN